MKNLIKTLTMALAGLAVAATAVAQNSQRFKKVEIMDNQGFARPMIAATMVVPADWKVDGGIDWMAGQRAGRSGPINTFNVTSPDGLSSFGYLPPMCIGQSNMPGMNLRQMNCFNGRASNADQALRILVSNFENGRVLSVKRDPKIAQQLSQANWSLPGDPYFSASMDMVIAEVSYTWQDRQYRGNITLMTTHTVSGMRDMFSGGVYETNLTEIGFAVGYGAPVEEYDERLFNFLTTNYRENVQWSMRMAEHYARINDINIQGARKRAQITAKANEEMRRSQADSWARQQRSRDNSNADFNDAIAGIWDYTTTDGDIITVPEHGGDLVEMPDGTFWITDDPAIKLEGTVLDWAPGRNFRD